ncbi:DUF4920 domain-containing protein [Sediminibacterium ginsengisoli]|uniref:DUF4920 domain-containing protein n=1 Tax=Sediminibacterium ginsengisoli TaxID=413434 RepID=A0A1T4KBY8_9BACT|nr:DUF4920 domain-containing protein [Sediminibacterium ginsengisoli]SJZ39843.1 protein of unknown function [Sediminibacterium ginsengisoli]
MKKVLFSLIVLAVAGVVNAQPPKGPVTPGTTFGAATNAQGAVAIATLPETLAKTATVDTKVKAKVLEVCPKKGCWMKLQVNDTTTAFVKMKDYGFFVPVEMVGKTIVLDGEASLKTTSVEELRHYAEDAKKSKEEIAAITKPQQEIKLTAKGIVIVD